MEVERSLDIYETTLHEGLVTQISINAPKNCSTDWRNGILIAEAILAIIINPITVFFMVKFKLLQKSAANVFIAGLCTLDFQQGITFFFSRIQMFLLLYTDPKVANLMGRLSFGFSAFNFIASTGTVLMIGIDRVVAMLLPMKYKQWATAKNLVSVMLSIWMGILMLILTPVVVKYLSLSEDEKNHKFGIRDAYLSNYAAYVTTPLLMFNVICIAICYAIVIIVYIRASRRIKVKSTMADKHTNKLTKMIISIVVVSFTCWMPVIIMYPLSPPDPLKEPQKFHLVCLVTEYSIILMLVPTFLNNIIYGWFQSNFRNALLSLCGCCHSNVVEPSTLSFSKSQRTS